MMMMTAVAARVTAVTVAVAVEEAAGAVAAVAATTTATMTAISISSLATIESTGAAMVLLLHGPEPPRLVVAQWSSAVRERDTPKQATTNSTDAPTYAPSSTVEDLTTERDI